jgi:hypothetical protein
MENETSTNVWYEMYQNSWKRNQEYCRLIGLSVAKLKSLKFDTNDSSVHKSIDEAINEIETKFNQIDY